MSPAAMARQLEEVQECREAAQAQVSSLSQVRSADSESSKALEYLEDQWTTAAQDAAAVIQNKEAQLQLVTDYCDQIQAAKTLLENQAAELEAVRSPDQSSSKEAERLCSLQRNMEENRTLLGELLLTHSKLIPLLSRSERTTAQTELKNLQDKWRTLERTVENSVHRA
uniref:Si:dkeyp-77c8.3 n=1 Tax=Acanthochromis polyacanthus TaxID=80966 RepID=A0A3Q1HP31_9TELE